MTSNNVQTVSLLRGADVAQQALAWTHAAAQARRRAMTRTVQALFREGLLDAHQVVHDGAAAWLPLWRRQGLLRFEGLTLGRTLHCRLDGGVSYHTGGQRSRAVTEPSQLLTLLAPALAADTESLARLQRELDNSVDNDTLCLSYRADWAQALRAGAAGFGGFFEWLRQPGQDNPALLLEQWGTLGHPWHPCYKTKLGLSNAEVVALSPEFQARISVSLAALHAKHAHVETAQAGVDYRRWFAERFPDAWQRWRAALAERGAHEADWLPLPVHPFQAQRVLPHDFAQEIEAGVLMLLPGVELPAAPTMSFRTVAPEASAELPHIKLPVSLRLTSVQRTVSPKSAVMGPRLTALLRRILDTEGGFGATLDILGEDIGIHYRLAPAQDDRARHVSALYRANPMSRRGDGLFAYPVGALFADSPLDGRPLVRELVALSGGDPRAWLEQYLRVALPAVLGPYLLYGIAFEAHQQNSFMLVDARGTPRRLLLRDFGDLRLHRPTLARRRLDLLTHREGHTSFDAVEPVRDKLLHAVFLCHVGELGLMLAHEYGLGEDVAWRTLAHAAAAAFDQYRDRTDAGRWAAERHALLEADWPAKSFLRMRLSDSSDDEIGRMTNPLRTA